MVGLQGDPLRPAMRDDEPCNLDGDLQDSDEDLLLTIQGNLEDLACRFGHIQDELRNLQGEVRDLRNDVRQIPTTGGWLSFAFIAVILMGIASLLMDIIGSVQRPRATTWLREGIG
jgi:hypothetical protein